MNEKFEDLLYRAGLTAQGCWDELGTYEQDAIERLYQLMVEEFSVFARQHNLENADRSYMIHQAVKRHFGVD
jgi:hypothetical protein